MRSVSPPVPFKSGRVGKPEYRNSPGSQSSHYSYGKNEEVVLRKLASAGCRHNVVLMDKGQCAQAWHNESSRPHLAGFAYTLIPVGVSGAFHPKVCILAGPKKAAILIGSHNLTLSGFGYNQEVTNWIEVTGIKDTEGAALLKATWAMLSKMIRTGAPAS